MIEAGPRRPLRRHERDPVEGPGPDHGRAGAHALARPDDRGHRPREAGRGARPRDARDRAARAGGAAGSLSRSRAASRPSRTGHGAVAGRYGARGTSSAGTSRSRRLPPRGVPRRTGRGRRGGARGREFRGDSSRSRTRRLTLIDCAHNPDGAPALAEALEGRRFTGVVAILDDKDAAAMLRELLPLFDHVVFTRSANPRSLSRPRSSPSPPS